MSEEHSVSQPQGQQHPPRTSLDRNQVSPITVRGISIGPDYVFSRGKRLTQAQRGLAIEYLAARDGGGVCKRCFQEFRDPLNTDIDHVDGDRHNHIARNLRLLCHRCNARIGWGQKQVSSTSTGTSSALPVSVDGGCGVGVGAYRHHSDADLLAISRRNETEFRRFYFRHILEVEGKMRAAEKPGSRPAEPNGLLFQLHPNVIRAMAREEVGVSRASALSYEERLVAPNGPLEVKSDEYVGVAAPFVGFRDNRCCKMLVEEIEALYPVEGQLYRRNRM